MNVVRKAVSALGGIFLAALLIAALAPKATRGIAAALVQVTNTAANPVQNQDITSSASQLVTLTCVFGLDDVSGNCFPPPFPPGPNSTPYTVPVGQNLVITEVEIFTPGESGVAFFLIATSGGQRWDVANDGTTHAFQFPHGGVVVLGGEGFSGTVFSGVVGSSALAVDQVTAIIHGYLTSN
jgi:hypothetical protein